MKLAHYATCDFGSLDTLVFEDTFTGDALNADNWTAIEDPDGSNQCEDAYFRAGNVTVSGGNMVLTTKSEVLRDRIYTSGFVHTLGKQSWTYGRFDIRAKLAKSQAYWNGLWMLPVQDEFYGTWPPIGGVYGGWPLSGEIDIVECIGNVPDRFYPGIHEGTTPTHDTSITTEIIGSDLSDDFHIYRLDWVRDGFRWWIDGVVVQTQIRRWYTSGGAYPAPYNQPFYLIISLQLGGDWPGNVDGTTIMPNTLLVDYVRVWQ